MKTIKVLIFFLLCVPLVYAGTPTDNLGLYKPTIGEEDWGGHMNNNLDTIDEIFTIGDCGDLTTDKVLYDHVTKRFFCASDQNSGASPVDPTEEFDPTIYGDITWGDGTSFTWEFDSGATDPQFEFGDGTLDIHDSSVVIHGVTSQVKFANNMYINGDTARKVKIGSTGGSNNETLFIDNDSTANEILFSTDSGATRIDTDTLAIQNTSLLNIFGGAALGNTSQVGCLILRDTDNAGYSECCALNGVLSCAIDVDGVPDGTL